MTPEQAASAETLRCAINRELCPRPDISPEDIANVLAALDAAQAAAQAPREAPPIPPIHGIHATFQWDGEKQHHVPQVLVSFEPVPANSPNDAPGWQHREQLVALLMKHRPLMSDIDGGKPA